MITGTMYILTSIIYNKLDVLTGWIKMEPYTKVVLTNKLYKEKLVFLGLVTLLFVLLLLMIIC
jgi:hypothetical protein